MNQIKGKLQKIGKKRLIILGLAVVVIIVAIAGIIGKQQQKKAQAKENQYRTMMVRKRTPLTMSGKVTAASKQIVALPSGTVQSIAVKTGSHVSQGQVVATVYNESAADEVSELKDTLAKAQKQVSTASSTLSQAQSALSQADSDDDDYSELKSQVTEAKSSHNEAVDNVSEAQNKLNTAQNKVYQSAKAPYAGIVVVNNEHADSPAITVYSDNLQLNMEISEYDYNKVPVGTKLTVTAIATKNKQETSVSYLSKVPDSTNGNTTKYTLNANLNSSQFINGQTVKVEISQAGVAIPKAAVRSSYVYVVKDGKAKKRAVFGRFEDGFCIVTDGLKAGETIVTNPDGNLKSGDHIE